MEQNNDWVGDMIKAQVDMAEDEAIGPTHLEKEVSKKLRESFVDKVKRRVFGIGANERRRDLGTRGRVEQGDPDRWLATEFKKKRDEVSRKQEMAQGLSGSEDETEGENDQGEAADDAREGLIEFRNLAQGRGEFTFKEDDGYSDPYPEPTVEELKQIEAEEKERIKSRIREKRFTEDRANVRLPLTGNRWKEKIR